MKIESYENRLLGSSPFYLVICFSYLFIVSICVNFAKGSSNTLSYIMQAVSVTLMLVYFGIFLKFGPEHELFKDLA
jgi:hypothetical protein